MKKWAVLWINFKIFLFFFVVSGYVSVAAFASLAGIPVSITSSAVGIKIFAINGGIKKYKPFIKN